MSETVALSTAPSSLMNLLAVANDSKSALAMYCSLVALKCFYFRSIISVVKV